MRPIFITPFTLVLATTIPSLTFGGMGYTTPKPTSATSSATTSAAAARDSDGFLHRPTSASPAATPQVAIAQQPYDLGQAIYNGTYKFKKATVTHGPEKAHRLGILQGGLPASEQGKLNSKELTSHLSDREMNALEYYVHVRFGKFVTVAPSWAKEEPPIKVSK
jgi:hypothetical protein